MPHNGNSKAIYDSVYHGRKEAECRKISSKIKQGRFACLFWLPFLTVVSAITGMGQACVMSRSSRFRFTEHEIDLWKLVC